MRKVEKVLERLGEAVIPIMEQRQSALLDADLPSSRPEPGFKDLDDTSLGRICLKLEHIALKGMTFPQDSEAAQRAFARYQAASATDDIPQRTVLQRHAKTELGRVFVAMAIGAATPGLLAIHKAGKSIRSWVTKSSSNTDQ